MEFKIKDRESFYEEALHAMVESACTEFLTKLVEKNEYESFKDFLLKSKEKANFPGNGNMRNRPLSQAMVNAAKISKAKLYVKEHYGRTIRIKEVADLVGFTANSFTNFFTKNTGQSFTAYLVEFRLEEACRLLQETDEPVVEIAYMTGYNSQSRFNNAFKKNKGISPGKYRKLCRKND